MKGESSWNISYSPRYVVGGGILKSLWEVPVRECYVKKYYFFLVFIKKLFK